MNMSEAIQRVIDFAGPDNTLKVRAFVSRTTAASLVDNSIDLFDQAVSPAAPFGQCLGAEWRIDETVADGDIRFEKE